LNIRIIYIRWRLSGPWRCGNCVFFLSYVNLGSVRCIRIIRLTILIFSNLLLSVFQGHCALDVSVINNMWLHFVLVFQFEKSTFIYCDYWNTRTLSYFMLLISMCFFLFFLFPFYWSSFLSLFSSILWA